LWRLPSLFDLPDLSGERLHDAVCPEIARQSQTLKNAQGPQQWR
jgi:hypothetical protein